MLGSVGHLDGLKSPGVKGYPTLLLAPICFLTWRPRLCTPRPGAMQIQIPEVKVEARAAPHYCGACWPPGREGSEVLTGQHSCRPLSGANRSRGTARPACSERDEPHENVLENSTNFESKQCKQLRINSSSVMRLARR